MSTFWNLQAVFRSVIPTLEQSLKRAFVTTDQRAELGPIASTFESPLITGQLTRTSSITFLVILICVHVLRSEIRLGSSTLLPNVFKLFIINIPFSLRILQPSSQPSAQPSSDPSGQPSSQPSGDPTSDPSSQPSSQPSSNPSGMPSSDPSRQPSSQPSSNPSGMPSSNPSSQPSSIPSAQPSANPSSSPSGQVSYDVADFFYPSLRLSSHFNSTCRTFTLIPFHDSLLVNLRRTLVDSLPPIHRNR